ncbi:MULTISPECIES: 3'-5' exonuclease [unclassified Variovorax]|uniref:3'-5' exonuclease n=1 Tax=unclassified Variovorax TaxID=663243 RepID=UPI00131791FC|nr:MULTISPECIES: 3'-5' exonuclease [unclassified Variovorax]VTU41768.1 DNA polymerase III subunit epsilon [Variovorax sp. PBL-H6]VTU44550.1 DNA polymerase III subunit epsilon [Variovorax sp. SRS16]VTU44593.1 DNA polymerase III subunit epsilon [Variovorax sp. PBL-E5]
MEISFNHVIKLAARLGRSIHIFDLECTTFRGMANFGITEVAGFRVWPDKDSGAIYSHLINPEREISREAQKLTGITQSMVADKELWGARYAADYRRMAGDTWLTGYNIKTFDLHAVKDMNERYGFPIDEFKFVFDVRDLHLNLSCAENKKGTLVEVAAMYGVTPKGAAHRAKADVILTVETLDKIIDLYGMQAVLDRILPKADGAYDKLTAQAIAKFVKNKTQVSLPQLAKAFVTDEKKVSFELAGPSTSAWSTRPSSRPRTRSIGLLKHLLKSTVSSSLAAS